MDGQEAQVDFTNFLAFVLQNPKSLGDIRGFVGKEKKKRERERKILENHSTFQHFLIQCSGANIGVRERLVSIGAMRICIPLVGNISGKWRDTREDLLM